MAEGRLQCKYQKIVEVLRQEILEGRYAHRGMVPSVNRVMMRFGVARATAVHVQQELKRMGLIVGRVGKGAVLTRKGRCSTGRIALLVHGSSYCEIFSPIARAVSHLCQRNGFTLLFAEISNPNNRSRVAQVIRLAREYIKQGIDGVIFQPIELMRNAVDVNRDLVALFDAAKVPVVLLDSDILPSPQRSDYDLAAVNHFAAGRTLADHLRKMGARRIAYLMQADRAPCVQERFLGIQTGSFGLALAGAALMSEPDDAARIRRFLKKQNPDAIACYNDRQAVLLVKTLTALGVNVPGDMLVAGFDDVNYATLATPTLTTMHQPCDELARLAFDMLMARIGNPDAAPRETFLTAPLVIRDSTSRKLRSK